MKKNDDFLCHYGVPKMKWYEHDSNRRQQGENAYAKKRNTKGFILKDEKDIPKDKKPSWMSNRDYYALLGGKQIAEGLVEGGKKVLESLSRTPIEEEPEAIEEGSKKFDRMLYSTIGILGRHVAKKLGISASITIKAPSSTSSNTTGKGAKEFDKMINSVGDNDFLTALSKNVTMNPRINLGTLVKSAVDSGVLKMPVYEADKETQEKVTNNLLEKSYKKKGSVLF